MAWNSWLNKALKGGSGSPVKPYDDGNGGDDKKDLGKVKSVGSTCYSPETCFTPPFPEPKPPKKPFPPRLPPKANK